MGEKGYKGFKKGMVCKKEKKYKENTTYEENGNDICKSGIMHYCENPFDVLDYYPLVNRNGDFSEFAEVEALGNVLKKDNKSASNKLHIGAKLSFKNFIKACIDFTLEKTKIDQKTTTIAGINTTDDYVKISSSGKDSKIGSSGYSAQIGSAGNCAQIGSSGYFVKIGSSGECAQIGSSGDHVKIGSSGYFVKIGSSGECAHIGSSGEWAHIGSSGECAHIGSSGDYAQIGSSGDYAQIGSSGDYAYIGSSGNGVKISSSGKCTRITASSENSVICCTGHNSIVRAKKGSWITLSEWRFSKEKNDIIPVCVKTEYVDGERIKEDTFYKLVDGEFKEIK